MITTCWTAKDPDSGRVVAIFTDWDSALNFATACQFLDGCAIDLEGYHCPSTPPCHGCKGDDGDGTDNCRLCLACRALVKYVNNNNNNERSSK